jgi:hypothetical protein
MVGMAVLEAFHFLPAVNPAGICQPVQSVLLLVKVITANIHVDRMARQIGGSTEKYAGGEA